MFDSSKTIRIVKVLEHWIQQHYLITYDRGEACGWVRARGIRARRAQVRRWHPRAPRRANGCRRGAMYRRALWARPACRGGAELLGLCWDCVESEDEQRKQMKVRARRVGIPPPARVPRCPSAASRESAASFAFVWNLLSFLRPNVRSRAAPAATRTLNGLMKTWALDSCKLHANLLCKLITGSWAVLKAFSNLKVSLFHFKLRRTNAKYKIHLNIEIIRKYCAQHEVHNPAGNGQAKRPPYSQWIKTSTNLRVAILDHGQ